jgi:hypothetical protein
VAERFADQLDLVGALQLRWHTRLAGRIEAALMESPTDPESAVISAWRDTSTDLPGIREVLDAYGKAPTSEAMAAALDRACHKDWELMAAMGGPVGVQGTAAATMGRRIEERARGNRRRTLSSRETGGFMAR